jgi:ATP-dependent helicase YprA (DUF1998 family)
MIPSLVVTEIRSALVEYLSSTFALADDEVRDALSAFLEDQADGIFRGPYLKVATPFRSVDDGWESPLEWLPAGFTPYAHQATAFERLSTHAGRTPKPTLVTTGTGSGKTECFLLPVLDHCARMRQEGHEGIKALILYPMNALASDQAGRIAERINGEAGLAGVTAGLYVGEAGRHSTMSAESIIDKRETLRAEPPDILLTNYKMLDFLLLRSDDRELWSANTPDTLRYVVLDEFHTYDGAQGTDVAMLLRRLGATLGMAAPGKPLGDAVPVATSATLGTGPGALAELRNFATKVFGTEFDATSVVGETRQTVEEACGAPDRRLPTPKPAEVADLTDLDDVANAFCRPTKHEDGEPSAPTDSGLDDGPAPTDDPVALGRRLQRHPLTERLLHVVGGRSRTWSEAVSEIANFADDWERALKTGDGAKVEKALAQFLRLLSIGRRQVGERTVPLFSVEVQVWIREVSRLLRAVDTTPTFRWRDAPGIADEDAPALRPGDELPAVYCRRCGMSGWMALATETGDVFSVNPATISTAALNRSPLIRTMMRAHPDDPSARWYSPDERVLVDKPNTTTADNNSSSTNSSTNGDHHNAEAGHGGSSLHRSQPTPVLISTAEDDAKANRCPGCGERDAVRFLGLAVASLASVSINTLFASTHLDEHERKLLAFTDSVQDASHRAGFFGSRTHRINLRSLMAGLVREHGELTLDAIGDLLITDATSLRDRFGLVPPDLLRHPLIRTVWTDDPADGAIDLLRSRIGFEADLEFGLRSRVGRTLELTRATAAEVAIAPDEWDGYLAIIGEEIERATGTRPDPARTATYLRGLLERLRLRGGIDHPLLGPFLSNGGRQWHLWGGRPDGLPPFTPDQSRPSFFTTATKTDLDSLTASTAHTPTWVVDWATRTLGLDPGHGGRLNAFVFNLLAKHSDTIRATAGSAATIYGLNRSAIRVVDLTDFTEANDQTAASQVRCTICGHIHAAPPEQLDAWVDTPCLRYRCVGRFARFTPRGGDYYRSLYRAGVTRRVVAGEHTGLLGRAAREDLERAFKEGTAPDAPNLLTATPTLEMGIDIGDLSAVMLTSVPRNPAAYIQRVGRAGRASGNSLVTTFVGTDTHGLYYLSDPKAMIAGDVRPPNCYLDAVETLQRQYLAYLIDRVADRTIDAPPLPHEIGALMRRGLNEGSCLSGIVAASTSSPDPVNSFLALFGDQLAPTTIDALRRYAAHGLEEAITEATNTWESQRSELSNRLQRLTGAIDRLEERNGSGTANHDSELAGLRGQRSALRRLLDDHRNEYTLSALERLGLLPNYTLVDDAITLAATMWSQTEDGEDGGDYQTETFEYRRSGRLAIKEFAPGNSFYAGGHRHIVDALEIGSAQEPLYENWRLCPDCGYAEIERADEPPTVCPRCAGTGIADTGARHCMLRLRTALASGSEEAARVFDDSDDRRRQRYDLITTIDVEPDSINGAWSLDERAFGTEFAGRAHVRTINLGLAERPGEAIPIAGSPRHVSRFTVCAHCGAVREARERPNSSDADRLHQGWCKVRSGREKEQWDPIILLHQLTTEAIRIVAPVSMFEIDERLASFKGALLLGLRADFGGDPDHLEVALADSPNRGGEGRRRFLVLFDRVPGGTGYLARMADPERMRRILGQARDLIARCPCTTEGRSACHRCLLGVVDRTEYDLVRRDLALGIIDDLLEAWQPHAVRTVGDIDIGKVQESELERRFRVALRDWADAHPNPDISVQTVPGSDRFGAFELRLELDGIRTRYRIDEQPGLTTSPSTIPDYRIRRMDERGPDVFVYLDGHQFHASATNNNIAADAAKRRGVRAEGHLVWNLTWNDVEAFHKAAVADPPTNPAARSLLKGQSRKMAQKVQADAGGTHDVDAVNQNPMALLLDFLARPDHDHRAGQWRRLALSAIGGLAGAAPVADALDASQFTDAVRHSITGATEPVEVGGLSETPPIRRFVQTTSERLPITLFLDTRGHAADQERWTVVATLDDDLTGDGRLDGRLDSRVDESEHRRRWNEWLHWSNIFQLAAGPTTEILITATSEADTYPVEDLLLASSAAAAAAEREGADFEAEITEAMAEELDLLIDEAVIGVVRCALRLGAPDFEAGPEYGGTPLEAAWVDRKVAVLASEQIGFNSDGWAARPPEEWSVEELVNVLKERS